MRRAKFKVGEKVFLSEGFPIEDPRYVSRPTYIDQKGFYRAGKEWTGKEYIIREVYYINSRKYNMPASWYYVLEGIGGNGSKYEFDEEAFVSMEDKSYSAISREESKIIR